MPLKPEKFLEGLYTGNKPEFAFTAKTSDEWRAWRKNLRSALRADIGCDFAPVPELKPQVTESICFDGYELQRVTYRLAEDLDSTAYVLIPAGAGLATHGRRAAIIAVHGHGYGSRDIVGLRSDGSPKTDEAQAGYQKNFAVELVKRGFIVIAPEVFGFGDRRMQGDLDKSLGESTCVRTSKYLSMFGLTPLGLKVHETMALAGYLAGSPDVDPDRIGCMGISGGGTVASFSAALDDRIAAAVVSGYFNTFKDSIMAINHCACNFVPGILRHAEMPDIFALIAPRPLLIEAGTNDCIFPIDAVKRAYAQLQQAYDLHGHVADRLDIDIFEGEHSISGAKAYDFLQKWLGAG